MEEGTPLLFTVHVTEKDELTPLDRTKLVRAFYEATAQRIKYTLNKDTDVAITSRPENDGGVLVGLAAPSINVCPDNLENIKEAYIRYIEANKLLGESKVTIDVTQERPRRDRNWSPVMLYNMVKHSREPAPCTEARDWLLEHSNEPKGRRYRIKEPGNQLDGKPDVYLIWDPAEYNNKFCPLKKTLTPGSTAKNEVATLLEIEVDACPRDLPQVNVLDFDKNKYVFEDIPYIFSSLLSLIQSTGTKRPEVWIDIIQVSACLDDNKYIQDVEKAISSVFTKQERIHYHLTPKEIESKHNEIIRKYIKKRSYFGFETMMEHLDMLDAKSFEQWKNNWLCSALKDLYNRSKQPLPGMGILASRYMRGEAVYESIGNRTGAWYSYDGRSKCWVKGAPLADKINELAGVVDNMVLAISKEKVTEEDQKNNLHLKQCGELVQSQLNREKILKEMSAITRMDSFSAVADKNYGMMPFINACVEVIEMGEKKNVIVRAHRKQDYTTKIVSAKYREDYNWDSPDVVKIMDFFCKFLPDYESREFLLYWCGSLLWRGNRDRCILQIVGGGGAGKTTFIKIVECLGDNAIQLKASAFYTDKRAGAADTEFYNMKGACVAIVDEIEPGRTGRVAVAKGASGGGRLVLRNLFQMEEMVDSTAKLLFSGNVPLHWPEDQAMKDRLHEIRAESRFSDNAPKDKESQDRQHHYPKDINFIINVDKLNDAIIWIFTEYLKKYIENGGLPKAIKIDRDTAKYWHDNDIYREFYEYYFTEDVKGRISQVDLFNTARVHFKNYHKSEYTRQGLITYIRSRLGTYGVDGSTTGYDESTASFWGIFKNDHMS